jgi:hypothetical protein
MFERVSFYELDEAELVQEGRARPGSQLGLLGGGRGELGGEPAARPALVDLQRGRRSYLMQASADDVE